MHISRDVSRDTIIYSNLTIFDVSVLAPVSTRRKNLLFSGFTYGARACNLSTLVILTYDPLNVASLIIIYGKATDLGVFISSDSKHRTLGFLYIAPNSAPKNCTV